MIVNIYVFVMKGRHKKTNVAIERNNFVSSGERPVLAHDFEAVDVTKVLMSRNVNKGEL